MPSFEEMSSWSADDALTNVRLTLPHGWALDVKFDRLTKVYACTAGDANGVEQWAGEYGDLRLLLLDLYGWLLTRNVQTVNPVWSRSRDVTPKVVLGDLGLKNYPDTPDPADLDPDEIRAVYEKRR